MPRKKGTKVEKPGTKDVVEPLTDESYVRVASTAHTPKEREADLLAQIARLQGELDAEKIKRSAAEQSALELADAQLSNQIQEIPTGNVVMVNRLDPKKPYRVVGHKDDGRDILRPNFIRVKLPTFFYKIDLPPVGGTELKTNGEDFFHGTTYTVDLDTLRSLKERVFRLWDHDRNVFGRSENFYRKPNYLVNPRNTISARRT